MWIKQQLVSKVVCNVRSARVLAQQDGIFSHSSRENLVYDFLARSPQPDALPKLIYRNARIRGALSQSNGNALIIYVH